MAQQILVKRSAVQGKVPTIEDLDLGEIAVNTYDGKMYIKKDNGTQTVVEVTAATGGGGSYLPLSGGTLTGDLTLNANPTTNLQAATKQYVDGVAASGATAPLNEILFGTGTGVTSSPVFAVNPDIGGLIFNPGITNITSGDITFVTANGGGVHSNGHFYVNSYGSITLETSGAGGFNNNVTPNSIILQSSYATTASGGNGSDIILITGGGNPTVTNSKSGSVAIYPASSAGSGRNQASLKLGCVTSSGEVLNVSSVVLRAPVFADLAPDVTFTLPSADGTIGQALVTNGAGQLSFATVGTGALTFPSTDGTIGQALVTNGAGQLSFATVASPLRLYAENSVGDGDPSGLPATNNAQGFGTRSFALGDSASAAGLSTAAIGHYSYAENDYELAIATGTNAQTRNFLIWANLTASDIAYTAPYEPKWFWINPTGQNNTNAVPTQLNGISLYIGSYYYTITAIGTTYDGTDPIKPQHTLVNKIEGVITVKASAGLGDATLLVNGVNTSYAEHVILTQTPNTTSFGDDLDIGLDLNDPSNITKMYVKFSPGDHGTAGTFTTWVFKVELVENAADYANQFL